MSPIQDIAYVRYQVTDLDALEPFLVDFGLQIQQRTEFTLYARAAGAAHHVYIAEKGPVNETVGVGFAARSAEDLERIALQVGKPVEDNPEPGGGRRVRFTDPAGFLVDVVHGQQALTTLPTREPIPANPAVDRKRLGRPVRLTPAASTVTRIGHVALLVADFPKTYAFYQEVLGFKPSDTYWAGAEANTVAAFMHCGLADQWTDHHTLALIAAPDGRSRFDHSSFEVIDLDDLVQGSEHLKSKGHKHSWGIGRHIQGSQLFDYWRDPFGNKVEHWTDGDLVNDATPVGHAQFTPGELSQWAPEITPEFFA